LEGVRHETTVPKTPEQNGVADAKLPHTFWAEALSTSVYVRNRSPTMAVRGMTPVEAWIGEKPNVEHL